MTVGDLAYECGIAKYDACCIARSEIVAFRHIRKGAAYGLSHADIAKLRPIFLASRRSPHAPMQMALIPKSEEDETMMSVQQIAQAIGYEADTIRKKVKELFPDAVENGKTTYLSEAQIVVIKQSLTPRTLALKSEVSAATTDLEMMLLDKQVSDWKTRRIAELSSQLAEKDQALAIAEPKAEFYDQVVDSKDAIDMRDAAAVLNVPGLGRNNLMAFLREKKILDANNLPYREFQERGYFRVVESSWTDRGGAAHISMTTYVYQKGLDYIRKISARIEAKA